jgi:hypothetical protein
MRTLSGTKRVGFICVIAAALALTFIAFGQSESRMSKDPIRLVLGCAEIADPVTWDAPDILNVLKTKMPNYPNGYPKKLYKVKGWKENQAIIPPEDEGDMPAANIHCNIKVESKGKKSDGNVRQPSGVHSTQQINFLNTADLKTFVDGMGK